MNVKQALQWFFGIALLSLLVASSLVSTSFLADELGFDFPGYAVRAFSAFDGWVKNHHFGLPAATFDGFLPALLPLFFKAIGFGSFTAPIAISILIMRLLLVAAIMFVAREFKLNPETGFLLGTIVAVNPITFKFLNRYYELFAWVAFLFAIVFILRFLNNKKRQQSLFFSVFFSAITLLSHLSPAFFLAVFSLFTLKPSFGEIKKFFTIGFFSLSVSLFWLLPFTAYLPYSGISEFDTSGFKTLGMLASSAFLIFFLAVAILAFHKFGLAKKYQRETQLLSFTLILAPIKFFVPSLPLLNRPLIHSFNLFYIIVLAIAAMILVKEKPFPFSKKFFFLIAVIALVPTIIFLPKIVGNYSFVEPRFSNYDFYGEKIDFSKIDSLLQAINKNVRFEVLPGDPIINAFAMVKYDLSSAYGWGYNIVAISVSNEKALSLAKKSKNCEEFNTLSEQYGISKWLALTQTAFNDLLNCGWQTNGGETPALFEKKNIYLIENGELLEYSNRKIVVKAIPPAAILKINYFPRWIAFSGNKKIEVKAEQKNSFILIPVEEEKIVQLKYGTTPIDNLGLFLSLASLIGFLFFLKKIQ